MSKRSVVSVSFADVGQAMSFAKGVKADHPGYHVEIAHRREEAGKMYTILSRRKDTHALIGPFVVFNDQLKSQRHYMATLKLLIDHGRQGEIALSHVRCTVNPPEPTSIDQVAGPGPDESSTPSQSDVG